MHGSYVRDELARGAWQHSACEQDGLHLELSALEAGTCACEMSTRHAFAMSSPQQSSRIYVSTRTGIPPCSSQRLHRCRIKGMLQVVMART